MTEEHVPVLQLGLPRLAQPGDQPVEPLDEGLPQPGTTAWRFERDELHGGRQMAPPAQIHGCAGPRTRDGQKPGQHDPGVLAPA